MAFILGMVNVFQIISHLPMYNILLTENTFFFLGQMQAVVGWDIWNPFKNGNVGFTPTLPVEQRFQWIGYISLNYFENIGSIAVLQLIFIFRALLNPLLHALNGMRVPKIAKVMSVLNLGRVDLCNQTIFWTLEAYLELLIGALIAINTP